MTNKNDKNKCQKFGIILGCAQNTRPKVIKFIIYIRCIMI